MAQFGLEHWLWEPGVVGSNPTAPTKIDFGIFGRKKKGFSQEKLDRAADISLNTLTKLESGFATKPTIQTIKKIADALGVKIDELVK